jgi:hypothetical protein
MQARACSSNSGRLTMSLTGGIFVMIAPMRTLNAPNTQRGGQLAQAGSGR